MTTDPTQIDIRPVTVNFENYQDHVVQIYREAYSLPPYNETEEKIQVFAQAWGERMAYRGFMLVMAYDRDRPVGMAYGWSSYEESQWTQKLKNQLGEAAEFWTKDNFEFADFAVSPDYQGKGISSRLYKSLFENISHKTAILYTHQSETSAYKIYLKKGWEVLREDLVFKSGKKFYLMGLRL